MKKENFRISVPTLKLSAKYTYLNRKYVQTDFSWLHQNWMNKPSWISLSFVTSKSRVERKAYDSKLKSVEENDCAILSSSSAPFICYSCRPYRELLFKSGFCSLAKNTCKYVCVRIERCHGQIYYWKYQKFMMDFSVEESEFSGLTMQ